MSIVCEYEFMFNLRVRFLVSGIGIWAAGTVAVRLFGQRLLHPADWRAILALFLISFPLMTLLVRRLCARFGLPRAEWPAGAISIALPTLLLDPFSCAFFSQVFPNIAPDAAGLFGGWTLCCCAGAMAGAVWRR